MKRALLALCALVAVGAAAETFERGTAYAYPIGPDFHYFNNDNKRAEMNINWPDQMMENGCSFGSAGKAPFGTAAVWFNNAAAQPYSVAVADELCPVVADPWNEGAYALKMQAPTWWGFGNFNFALPDASELCRVRAIFRCDVTGASDARKDNSNGILFRITDTALGGNEEGIPGPNAKVEIPDIWEHPELYRVVDLYTDQLDGNAYFAITFMPAGFSCGGEQPAFYLEEVSIVPTKLLAGDNHVAGEQVVTAVAERPELTVIDGEGTDVVDKNKLVAGTVDAPNYYVFKTGRGTPYLAYSAESLTTANGIDTHLHRTGELTEANIWAVTPGDAEGTLHITAYGTNLGLMDFVNADGAFYHIDAVATVSNPQDIYPVYNDNGTVSLCLNNSTGRGDDGNEFYTLDASLRSDFLGNWCPNDDGSNWTTFQLDMTDGVDAALAAVEHQVAGDKEAAQALIEQKINILNDYITNVPWVTDELNAGIEALSNIDIDDNYKEKIAKIYDDAIARANAILATCFDGKIVAFKNLRRAANFEAPYMDISYSTYFTTTDLHTNATALFTLTSTKNGGYTIYNAATKTYLSTNCNPTTDVDAAQIIYPILYTNGAYTGVALPINPDKSGHGLNYQSGSFSYLPIADSGSIWTFVEAKANDIINANVAHLEAYIPAVPETIANILTSAIDEIKGLSNSEAIVAEAEQITDSAINAANSTLATYFDGQTVAFKSLRRVSYGSTPYVGISTLETPEKYYGVESFSNVTADFTLKSVGDGGYTVYNEATKTWLGWVDDDCCPTTDETLIQPLYPRLHTYGAYAGIALYRSNEETNSTGGLNFQYWENGKVCYWYVNDEGSIWSIVMADDDAKAKEAIDTNVAKLERYVPAMPEMVANILTNAIDEIKALKYSETIGEEAAAIADKAISAANEFLATGLNDMNLSLKNLRQNQFISIADGEWIYDENNEAEETAFTFIAQADGGYILYNKAANIYVGQTEPEHAEDYYSNTTIVTVATEEADAMVVYPFICKGGNHYGIALAVEADPNEATTALNTNTNAKIFHTYRASDAGSIWALVRPGTVNSNIPADAVKLQGIVCKVGDSVEVSAVVEPENASDQTLNWSSSNPEVAAVDADGVVWFNAAGNATVTAECQGYEISVPFVVREVVARALNVFPVEAVGGVGHEFSLLALHEPENTTDKSVTWESSDPEVATVSEDGRVSLASLGTAQITARSGEHTAVCSVTVNDIVGLTEMASSGVVIDIVEGGIIVRNAPVGEMIAVYAVDGKAVNGAFVENDETRLNLAAGIYIVKVSPSTVAKVLVK